MFSVIELQVLTMGLSDMGFCVFSLGSICVVLMFWIRVVVGSMSLSWMTIMEPLSAFCVDDSIMDDKLFQGLSLFVCCVVLGFQWHL